jgi:cell division protein FtsB
MSNPNNNQNALQLALQINRSLKKEIDNLKEEIDNLKEEIHSLKIATSIKVPFSHSKDAEVKLSKEEYIAKIGELNDI